MVLGSAMVSLHAVRWSTLMCDGRDAEVRCLYCDANSNLLLVTLICVGDHAVQCDHV